MSTQSHLFYWFPYYSEGCIARIFLFWVMLFAPLTALHAQNPDLNLPDVFELHHIIELDNDTYINTVNSLSVSPGGWLFLLDSYREEGYLVPAVESEQADSDDIIKAAPTRPLSPTTCGQDIQFTPYGHTFTGSNEILIYNRFDRPLIFDANGDCRSRLPVPVAGAKTRVYAEMPGQNDDAQPVRGLWTHEVQDEFRHSLHFDSFGGIRAERKHITLNDADLPVLNAYLEGGALIYHSFSENLYWIGAASASVHQINVAAASDASIKKYRPHQDFIPEQNEDLEAELSPSRRMMRIADRIQRYGRVDQVYRLDEHSLIIVYKKFISSDESDSGNNPAANRPEFIMMLFDMDKAVFSENVYSLGAKNLITGAGNGLVYVARRSEEASLERGIINPLIYAYELKR
jgi:hypothetical protein